MTPAVLTIKGRPAGRAPLAVNSIRLVAIGAISAFLLALSAQTLSAQPRNAWVRSYSNGIGGSFEDIYRSSDGNFALTGGYATAIEPNRYIDQCWWLLISPDGAVISEGIFGQLPASAKGYSVIELDNGDFAIAGHADGNGGRSDAMLIRLRSDGEEIWRRNYGGNLIESFYALIELKEGMLLACGLTRSMGNGGADGYLIKVDGDGEIIWERAYGTNGDESFRSMREVEDGVILAGSSNSSGWLSKVDRDGEPIWSQERSPVLAGGDTTNGSFYSLITCRDGGLLAVGATFNVPFHWAFRGTLEGDQIWSRLLAPSEENGLAVLSYSAVQLPDNGFELVGFEASNGAHSGGGSVLRLDREGVLQWQQLISNGNWNQDAPFFTSYLASAIKAEDGAVVVCGPGYVNGRSPGGIVIRYVPERSAPIIIEKFPRSDSLECLPQDILTFWVRATDAQGDSLRYLWQFDRDSIGADTFASISIDNIGRHVLSCVVSDGDLADSVSWMLSVTDLFIVSHTPDTLDLNLRRGASVDFAIDSVAAVEGDAINYRWTLDNPDNPHPEVISRDSLATIEFLRSGNYALEAFAGRGESFDVVTWTISVRSAIWSFWPDELSLTVPPDTLINFGVNPFNPESDSLSYAWYFGEDLLGMDSTIDVQFGGEGRVQVTAIVADGAEVDTILWNILVQPLDAVESNFLFPLSSFALFASPNPFNASTTIRWTLPSRSAIKLKVFDLSGREVTLLVDREEAAGEHSVVWEGTAAPAGIYLIRLESNLGARTAKVVMIK